MEHYDWKFKRFMVRTALLLLASLCSEVGAADVPSLSFGASRLAATGGITQIEGSAGGGLVPWALVAGYGSREEVDATAFFTRADPSDFKLSSGGVAVGIRNRLEISAAEQRLGLGTTVPGAAIRQSVFGLKVRLFGDAVFAPVSAPPQVALGVQYKRNLDFQKVPAALGAKRAADADYYLAATKVFLGVAAGRNVVVDATARATRANQLGLLGFGGDKSDRYSVQAETSIGLFVTDRLIAGVEYRHKPDNLSVFREDSFKDLFIAWLPHKRIALTVALANLGTIADKPGQHALYTSLHIDF